MIQQWISPCNPCWKTAYARLLIIIYREIKLKQTIKCESIFKSNFSDINALYGALKLNEKKMTQEGEIKLGILLGF